MDGLSAHWTPDIGRWAHDNNVGLLPTPTNASHLNRVECHFWAFVEFVIKDSDYADWSQFTQRSAAYIRRRKPRPPRPPDHRAREPPQGRLRFRRNNPRRPTSASTADVEPCTR
jgi:hypothetical protein